MTENNDPIRLQKQSRWISDYIVENMHNYMKHPLISKDTNTSPTCRSIYDVSIVCYKILHSLKKKKQKLITKTSAKTTTLDSITIKILFASPIY